MKKIHIVLSSIFLLWLNSTYAQAEATDNDLIESYKQNFMKSCLESGDDKQHRSTCNCVLNSVLNNFSPAQLKDEKEVTKYIQNVALINCQS